jgi:hypothetical protein
MSNAAACSDQEPKVYGSAIWRDRTQGLWMAEKVPAWRE